MVGPDAAESDLDISSVQSHECLRQGKIWLDMQTDHVPQDREVAPKARSRVQGCDSQRQEAHVVKSLDTPEVCGAL